MTRDWIPIRFIDQEVRVEHARAPAFSKKPDAPQRFNWGVEEFEVVEVLRDWAEYGRRGRMAKNMSPEHMSRAETRGSWGVGRRYFRLRTLGGRVFDLYYDRAPKDSADRAGHWILWRELAPPA